MSPVRAAGLWSAAAGLSFAALLKGIGLRRLEGGHRPTPGAERQKRPISISLSSEGKPELQ
jgi:hypothetical protein